MSRSPSLFKSLVYQRSPKLITGRAAVRGE